MTVTPMRHQFADGTVIIAASESFQRALSQAARYGKARCNVLISGETGVGKEVIARYVHEAGGASRPFVDVNCAAIPESLFEAILFGHRRGTFTGATEDVAGLVEAADGGTLYLDELCSMPLDTQAKLLRVIEQRVARRLGELKSRGIDVQFVGSIQGRASAALGASRVRSDLFYRLGVGQVFVPPLRERPSDLRALARYEACRLGLSLEPAAEKHLLAEQWTGNVRELFAVLARAAVLCDTGMVSEGLLREVMAPDQSAGPEPSSAEARSLKELCDLHEWDTAKVAVALQVSRATVYRRLDRLGIRQVTA